MPKASDSIDRPAAEAVVRAHPLEGLSADDAAGAKDLRPIGPKRLRELRKAIEDGTYPTDEHAAQGLLRMFLRSARRRPGS